MIFTKLKENGIKVACNLLDSHQLIDVYGWELNLEGKDPNIVDEIAYQFTQLKRIIIYLFFSICNL